MKQIFNISHFALRNSFSRSAGLFALRRTRSHNVHKHYSIMTSNSKPTVFVTRRVPESGINIMKEKCIVRQWESDDPIDQNTFMERIQGVDALFCLLSDKVDKAIIANAGPNLKVIGTMSVGFDHIDLDECASRDITVCYTPGVLTDATATLTVTLLLTAARRISEGITAVRDGSWGTWAPLWLCGPSLTDATVGIVGLGSIGLAVAKRLQGFGVGRFLYSGNRPKQHAQELAVETNFVPFDELLKQSDFVVVTCTLNEHTKGMFDKAAFAKMKPSAVFVNISRGAVVVQDDLVDALRNKVIAYAGLDVTTPEPLPTDSPLLSLDNCVVLPHIGSAETTTRSVMSEMTAYNILSVLKLYDNDKYPVVVKK